MDLPLVAAAQLWLGSAIILVTLLGVAIGRYPLLRMNRATIALVGATALIGIGAISLDEAFAALDLRTLALLFAMMVLNTNLRLAGFFQFVAVRVIHWAKTPRQLLALIIITAGICSALFLNDTIVLMFTPLVIEIVVALKRNPLPYLIGLVAAANIGSVATITGNPQNMLIGVSSGIAYLDFVAHLGPVALLASGVIWGVLVWRYRQEFSANPFESIPDSRVHIYPPLFRKAILATLLMLAAFLLNVDIALAALGAASLLLITRRIKPQRVFKEIDLALLVFFSSLFIVTGAIASLGLSAKLFAFAQPFLSRGIVAFTATAVVLSNLVSNVPAVLLMRSLIPALPDPAQGWFTLAMATTLAGNLTLLGSVANLIVAESAKERGITLSFGEYFKAGLPITLGSLAVGVIWLSLVF
jgi:Na+/H+ antiporter NhaD/arsenite permease-like protein